MEHLSHVLDHSFDAVICFGEDRKVVVWNPEAERLFGVSARETVGRDLAGLSEYLTLRSILPFVSGAFAGELTQRVEVRLTTPSGPEAILEVVVTARAEASETDAGVVALIARDLRLIRQAQTAIRESEERFQFLNDLGETTRTLVDPGEIMATIARLLGEHLRVSRCAYADVEADSDRFTIRQDYTDGCASTVGEYQLALFGPRAVTGLLAGETLVIHDVDTELAAGEGAEMFNAIGIKAVVCCPLARNGRLRAMMAVHQTTPRRWVPREIALIEEVVERCWAIIERAKADAVLRITETLKSAILDTSLDGFILMDHEGRIVDWNSAAEQIFGLKRDQVVNRVLGDVIFPERLREKHRDAIARYVSGQEAGMVGARYEVPALRSDGVEFPSEISITHIPGTEPPLFARFVRDITERKNAECALRKASEDAEAASRAVAESAERFRLVGAVVELQVWTAGLDGGLDYANEQCADYFGTASPAEVFGNAWAQFVHPDDLPATVRQWQRSLETGEPYEVEFRLRRHDGVYRYFLVRAQAMRDAEGAISKWFGTNTDIDDLKKAQGEAERANRAKDTFLAALSHELRTPLTPVLMAAAALREDERLPGDVREQLGMMERNISLEARLIDDLLDLTRIARGQLQLRAELCDLHSLIGLATEIVREDATAKGISLKREFTARQSGLVADPARFQQLVWNLLRNAVKFTPRGGSILVRTRDDDESRVRIEVTDSGIGIEQEALERIFLPFEQGENGGQHRFGGIGLGLAIARTIVVLHGGKIDAQSEGRNRGATFTVSLPGAVAPPTGLPSGGNLSTEWLTHGAGLRGGSPRESLGLRLLLVEDHESTLRVLTRLLERAGHHVVTAGTLADALAVAGEQEFDLVISDLGLPDGTGNELMEILRSRHRLRGIALSGYGMEEDIARSRQAGFSTHLTKPIDFPQLDRALREMMEGRLP